MGEAKRRKKLDPNYGKRASDEWVARFLAKHFDDLIKNALSLNRDSMFIIYKNLKATNEAINMAWDYVTVDQKGLEITFYIKPHSSNSTQNYYHDWLKKQGALTND